MQHIYSGTGAPTSAPTGIGHHYVDTANKRSYLSVGTDSAGDWYLVGSGGGGTEIQAEEQRITVTADHLNAGYIDLPHLALPNTVLVIQGRLVLYKTDDYTLTTASSVTRINLASNLLPGSEQALSPGELLLIRYSRTP